MILRQSRATMYNGTSAFPPQGGSLYYNAFWLRDYSYMLEGCPEAFAPQEMENSLTTFVNAMSPSGASVDHVDFNGTPEYGPAANSVADGSQFLVDCAT